MLREGLRYKRRVWTLAMRDWVDFIKNQKTISGIAFAASILIYHFLIFGQTEGIAEIRPYVSLVAAGLTIGTAVFLWELFWSPFRMEQETRTGHESVLSTARNDIEKLTRKNVELQNRVDRRRFFIEGSHKMLELVEEGSRIRDNMLHDPGLIKPNWHNRVRLVLKDYFLEAEAGFAAVQSRFNPEAHRDIIREEIRSIEGGILVSMRS